MDASPFTHFLIEIDVEGDPGMQGIQPAPTAQARANILSELRARLQKPGGVELILDPVFPDSPTQTWTLPAIAQQAGIVRRHYDGPNCAVIHYLLLGGQYTTPEVLGLAYTGSSLAVLEDRLAGNLGPFLRAQVESAVMVHEAGHLFGLVDIGTPMVTPHEDVAGGHDISDACVMFASISTSRVAILQNPPEFRFDPACVADLQAIGGK